MHQQGNQVMCLFDRHAFSLRYRERMIFLIDKEQGPLSDSLDLDCQLEIHRVGIHRKLVR